MNPERRDAQVTRIQTSVFRVVDVAAAEVRLTLRPNGVDVSRRIADGFRIIAVGMIESRRRLIVAEGSRLRHDLLGTPARRSICTAAHVHVPDAAGSCRT